MVRNYIRKTDRGMTYSKEKLLEAVAKIRSGELNGYEAANRYNIPRTTLYDYAKGKTFRSLTLGKPPALSSELEKVIADNLLALQDNGFYFGRKDTLDLVGLYLKENKIRHPFKSGKPGECWLTSFCKRTNVTCKPLYKEFGNQDKEVVMVKEFYCILEMRIDKLELADKPGQIWHIEEHSFCRGKRVNSYDKEKDLTMVTICSAEGRKAPLLTVFKGDESHEWMLGKHVNVSHNSGMCREVFKSYFTTAFLNYIDDSKPNLVIFQGQSSLIDLDIIEAARKGQVTLIHAPNYLDNLNISIARTLKLKWGQIFGESTKEFATAASQRFDDLQEIEISEDFKNAGVHPFAAVCDSKFGRDRLKIYEEFVWFKDRHQNSMQLNKDTEQVMVNEDMEFQMNFEAEFDSSTSVSMTEEVQTPNKCSGEILRRALISVKKELMQHEQIRNNGDLTKAEEDHLVEYVTDLTNAGFIVTEDQLIEAVDNIQGNPLRTRDQHRYTYECFLKSHPRLKEKLSREVSHKITQESINVWLYRVRMYLKKYNLEDVLRQPKRIFNFGEIALNLNTKAKDQDHETDITNDDMTVFVAASADGYVQAPSVLIPIKQSISCPWSKAEILTDQVTDVFYGWLTEHNIQLPVVLFVHQVTHINLSLFEFCKEKQIVLLALPHIEIQPLEEVFRPLREYWNENSDIKTLKKEELAKVLENYVKKDFSKEITKSFKACGIYPFNTNVKYNTNEIQTETNVKENHKEGKKENKNQVNLLEEVEKRISSEVLDEFKKTGDVWQGDPRHVSLFLFWKNVRDENKEDRREPQVFLEICLDEVNVSAPDCKVSNMLI
ncbi:uncharacterized protein LOC134803247 [Cydia splendana]|uniref:uncharacterized protein LOC134803247 n=1 Tax=Cydia splendana TaxID=1100963 RepID=UPI0021334E14